MTKTPEQRFFSISITVEGGSVHTTWHLSSYPRNNPKVGHLRPTTRLF